MRYRGLVIALAVACWAGLAAAQFRSIPPSAGAGDYIRGTTSIGLKSLRGLLDPSRMHMSHSFSFGYMSVGGRGVTQGLYMNRIDYQIARPLWITTNLGYLFQASGPSEWNPAQRGGDFVGGATLNWRPTSNTSFRFSVYQGMSPEPSYGYYGWGPYDYRADFDRP
jgi:hypothetical protein